MGPAADINRAYKKCWVASTGVAADASLINKAMLLIGLILAMLFVMMHH